MAPRASKSAVKAGKAVLNEEAVVVQIAGKQASSAVSINEDDKYFAARLDLVPAKYYMAQPEPEHNTRYHKNKKGKAPKQGVKESSKKGAKRRKKYAEEMPSSTDVVMENARKEEEEKMQREQERAETEAPRAAPARNIAELKERMANRLALLRTKRQRQGGDQDVEPPVKKTKQSRLEAKREAKREKKRARKKVVSEARAAMAKATDTGASSSNSTADVEPVDQEQVLRNKVTDSILNPKISFGPLTGTEDSSKNDAIDISTPKRGKNNILNIKQLLKKAEENKAVIEELKSSSNIQDRQLAAEKGWDKLEKKALGERVPEPKHLKNHIKRIERKKKKSTKEWNARLKSTEEDKRERIEKRQANIDKAQKEKINAKLKRKGIPVIEEDKETRRQRPGFEGKRTNFLNDKDGDKKSDAKEGKEKHKR